MLVLFLNPLIIYAYSSYIYAGGESIGIELKSKYILVVGTYKVNNKLPNLKVGDKIITIDSKRVNNIIDMSKQLENKENVKIGFIRENQYFEENVDVEYKDNLFKTGLYVKDEIIGIGTLTYIDPGTNLFGCLGHEINEKTTKKLFDSDAGTIFKTNVSRIVKSKNGAPGEKIAKFENENTYGKIKKNTKSGIYGKYISSYEDKNLYEVAHPDEIKLGAAKILTTISGNKIEEFDINIIKLSNKIGNHDILFEVTDQNLLSITNGIIQGMSGSPIIQGNKIIGAVTHVIVDNPKKGYGIYIEKMLVEGEN